uniref:lysozyme n=1 Tax=Calidris pygmaea TaxID=425635 RepID=A0A8C3PLM1_9CHAR
RCSAPVSWLTCPQEEGLDGYVGYSLANCEFQSPLWHRLSAFCPCPRVCMTFYESTFKTATQSIKVDGSTDREICSGLVSCPRASSWGSASLPADLLSSNMTDDICAKRIVRNPQGMNSWEGWATHCKGQGLSEWAEGCDL